MVIFEKNSRNKIFSRTVISSKNGPPTKLYQKSFCLSDREESKKIFPFDGFRIFPIISKSVDFPTHDGP